MSTVYLAHDPRFERDVAIKLLPLELLHQPTFRRRFEREAKVVASLDHPAIVPVYDFGEMEGQPFLVMRFMTGGSLAERLLQGVVSLPETARIMKKLAPALDEVHAYGIIHRDLKPSNILFDQRNEPYLSDFGTAKLKFAQTKLTDTGGAVGTPAYMSPEQIQGEAELDGRSDIYSLGVILFEMLAGKHPFQTNTPIAIAVKHMFEPVPNLQEMEPNLPPACQEVIVKAMAKQKEHRYRTAVDFAAAVEELSQLFGDAHQLALAEKISGQRYALIIANYEYDDATLAQLIKPKANIHTLAYVLQNPAVGGFCEVNTLINESANGIRRAISQFFAERKQDDLLLIYFLGHAALGTRGQLYLAAKDTEHDLLRGTAIPTRFIADEMDNSLSEQQILVLDCYYSDTVPAQSPGVIGRNVNNSDTFAHNGFKRVIVTANDSTQYNWAKGNISGEAKPSLFTEHFVQGLLSGAADTDHDGKISIDDVFAYIQQQLNESQSGISSQIPRKWTPFSHQNESNLVIASNPNYVAEQVIELEAVEIERESESNREPEAEIMAERPYPSSLSNLLQRPALWLAGLALLATVIIVLLAGQPWRVDAENLSNNPPTTPTTALTDTTTTSSTTQSDVILTSTAVSRKTITAQAETATSEPMPSPTETVPKTAVPTQTETSSPEPTSESTAVATETFVAEPIETAVSPATALLSSSLFVSPSSNSQEITFIGVGEVVTVLGRSEIGVWFYVQNGDGQEGFVYGPRLEWDGDFESLAMMEETAVSSNNNSENNSCTGADCPALTINLYPLPGTSCETDAKYRTVFIEGQGGNGRYTYYWKGEKVAGPIEDGFGFEINTPDGSAVIGIGKVISGDGQTVELELFVSDFDCS
ncbi:MAG: protein kinase [Chloroflexi bacterium]|nr:protein kinase [Chloroflexota bacterium]